MRWLRGTFVLALLLSIASLSLARELIYTDGLLLIRFNQDVLPQELSNGKVSVQDSEVDRLLDRFGATEIEYFFGTAKIFDEEYAYLVRNDYKIWFPKGSDMELIASEFENAKLVEWACIDEHVPVSFIPNDPHFNNQYFHDRLESSRAWDILQGSDDVLVSAIDSGIEWLHEDLYDNIWVNPGEDIDGDPLPNGTLFPNEPGTTGDWDGLDNDGNGLVDDFIGWDFVDNVNGSAGEDNDQPDNNPMDFNGHGTGCNAAIAQVGNNSLGGLGVAFGCKIVSMRAGYNNPQGEGLILTSAGVECLNYLRNISIAEDKTMIVNMSYGGGSTYQPMINALNSAWNTENMLMFGAAGNDNWGTPQYPANYNQVICVGATNQSDARAYFSNYGTWVDIAAPGVACRTAWFGGYESWDGTSVASPIAAGVGALIAGRFPDQTNEQWRTIIETTVDEISPDHPIGSGRVNAYKALTMTYWPEITIESVTVSDPDGNGHPDVGEEIEVRVEVSNAEGWQEATLANANLSFDVEGVELLTGSVVLGSIAAGESTNNNNNPLIFRVPEGNNSLDGIFANMTVSITSTPNDYEVATSQRLLFGTPDIIFVDDDEGGFQSMYITDDLEEMGFVYYHMDRSVYDTMPTLEQLSQYSLVLWHTSQTENPFSDDDITLIQGAMDNGVNFMISGEDIDEQLTGTDFYANYLRAEHSDAAGNIAVDAIPGAGGPVEDGQRLILTGTGGAATSTDPDVINPVNGSVAGFGYINAPTDFGGIYYDGDYKLVFFPFCFESVSDAVSTSRVMFLQGMMTWMDLQDVESGSTGAEIPQEFAITAAYPNPFNPSTNLTLAVAHNAKVVLKVYDILGREVATLHNGRLAAGMHDFQWNATMNAAGVYFAVMQADGMTSTRKLVFMK